MEYSATLNNVERPPAQQGWLYIVKPEEPAQVRSWELELLMSEERASRVAMQDKSMLVPTMEAAAARRRQGLLPGPSWWGEGNPPGRAGWRWGDPTEDAVLLTPQEVEPQMQQPAPNQQQPPDLARVFLELQHMRTQQTDTDHHRTKNREHQTTDRGRTGSVTAGKGERGLASDFPRSTQSQTINKIKVLWGQDSKEDRR